MEQNQQSVAIGKNAMRRSEEEILKLLDEQQQSGFTVKEYCEMIDIVEQTFYSWMKKYRNKPEDQAGFTKIEVIPTSDSYRIAQSKPQLFAEVGKIRLYKEVSTEYLTAVQAGEIHNSKLTPATLPTEGRLVILSNVIVSLSNYCRRMDKAYQRRIKALLNAYG